MHITDTNRKYSINADTGDGYCEYSIEENNKIIKENKPYILKLMCLIHKIYSKKKGLFLPDELYDMIYENIIMFKTINKHDKHKHNKYNKHK